MSYTTRLKNELAVILPESRCCRLAELAGLINTGGSVTDENALLFKTENWAVARKYFTLMTKTFKIDIMKSFIKKTRFNKNSVYELNVSEITSVEKALNATGVTAGGVFTRHISSLVTKNSCCKRSYIRGTFLSGGSISSPDKSYHLEISLKSLDNANSFIKLLLYFDICAKAIKRQNAISVYVKDSGQISDFLNASGAVNALFTYENTKVLKEVRNDVNRQVNCDAANIKRAVTAAQKQIRAIELIENTIGVSSLPKNLAITAEARKNNPEMKLEELGQLLGISKSGISHRLKKIEETANIVLLHNTNLQ